MGGAKPDGIIPRLNTHLFEEVQVRYASIFTVDEKDDDCHKSRSLPNVTNSTGCNEQLAPCIDLLQARHKKIYTMLCPSVEILSTTWRG